MTDSPDRVRLTASERDGIVRLELLVEIATEAMKTLDKRMGMVKNMRRDVALIKSLSYKSLDRVLDTVPVEQLISIKNNLKMTSYTVGARMPGEKVSHADYGCWISWKDLETITGALKDRCMLCDFDRQKERSCPIKKALDNIGIDVEHGSGCGYRGII